ncbi:hypothetical protein SAMN05192583_3255 [Sphingomonas gellani]|uniref:Uncharacterized protein n=1 Tax=Sphingomonas gellani TaxID=1166340 RepID=A0A1H8IAG8_9SPHN|nr:hypothetical protein [Sphingomonas gellani]SEN65036.1 hypothetical protein SAMN05192583_3255 [Sphingomonas gellani]
MVIATDLPSWLERPAKRRLRVYAFDPRSSVTLETAICNDTVIELPWETPWEDALGPGPCNDYIEVVDYDPACGLFYAPVDLDHPHLLAQDGLPQAEGQPQFHQQMVFAVAMKTVRVFERALGRGVIWARTGGVNSPGNYVKRLRIYPHALREANAYYSPDKTALLFGYFKPDEVPGQDSAWVFTCLSHDIVAHETAHAILHGLQPRTIDASNPDMLAFHEGFADIVALLQHFTMTEVVEQQIVASSGSLRANGLLTGIAAQFGHATGRAGALRYALQLIADEARGAGPVRKLEDTTEPHDRGQFLVAAIFDAFATIYERRTADLFRLADYRPGTSDTLPIELARRLAREAGKTADQVLRICVRGLDYLPPVDNSFGEYLRAIVTADADLVPDDPLRYRVAFADAFRKRGIPVPGCISYAPSSLMWAEPDLSDLTHLATENQVTGLMQGALARLKFGVTFDGKDDGDAYASSQSGKVAGRNLREKAIGIIEHNQVALWQWLNEPSIDPDTGAPTDEKRSSEIDREWESLLGIRMVTDDHPTIALSEKTGKPAYSVNTARIARRQGPDGQELHQLIAHITQRRRGYFDKALQDKAEAASAGNGTRTEPPAQDFWFRGGATVIVDLRDGRVRRIIRKRIDDGDRLVRQRAFHTGEPLGMAFARRTGPREPFALVHRA